MKITLIRAPITMSKYATASPAVPPIGMAYVASSLVKNGYIVKVIDSIGESIDSYCPLKDNMIYRGLSLEEIVGQCSDSEYFGFSIMFSQDWLVVKQLIKLVKLRFPNSRIVVGGEHPTAEPYGTMRDCTEIDFIVAGEGDDAIINLLDSQMGKLNIAELGNIFYRDTCGDVKKSSGKYQRQRNLDDYAWPAWDLFPLENYLAKGHGWGVNRGRNMPIVATRGCPYQCTFCSSPNMWTTRWTARSPEDVIAEIEHYIKIYNASNFDFQDLTAIIKKEWIKIFCQLLIDKKLNVSWQLPTGTRTEALDGEIATLLYRSGCKNITYAPESGSLDVLKRIKKKVHLQHVFSSARSCVQAGLDVKFNFIFGFPEDKAADFYASIRFMAKLALIGVSDISVAPFSPYPGSELFYALQRKGKIPLELDDNYYEKLPFSDMTDTVSWCESFNSKQLNQWRLFALLIFYFVSWTTHPSRPFKRISNLVRGVEESRLDKSLSEMLERIRGVRGKLRATAVRPF